MLRPRLHPILYVVQYLGPIGPWSKAVHYVGNRVQFGTQPALSGLGVEAVQEPFCPKLGVFQVQLSVR